VKGHTLVIPRAHYDRITDVPLDLLGKLIAAVQTVARAQVSALRADGVNVTQANGAVAGQVVPHLHFPVSPRFEGDGQSFNWRPVKYAGAEEMNAVAERIRTGLRET
jgi:histidine triad (HIT) family protein